MKEFTDIVKRIRQKHNWYRNRFRYMKGIKSYHQRHNSRNKKASILDKIIKAKKRIVKEGIVFLEPVQDLLLETSMQNYISFTELENILEEYTKILQFYGTSIILEDSLSNLEIFLIMDEVLKPMRITDQILELCDVHEYVIDSTPMAGNVTTADPSADMANIMYNDDKYTTANHNNAESMDMHKDPEVKLDMLQVWIEKELSSFGVTQTNVDSKDDIVHIDLNFKGGYKLTFALYVDPKSKPRIDCIAKEGQGKDEYLPGYYSVGNKLFIDTDFEKDFPIDFMISCIKEYIPAEHIEITESQRSDFNKLHLDKPMMEIAFRKVIRHGLIKWEPVASSMSKRRRVLTYKQKLALEKARGHAHSRSAELSRSRSKSIGYKHNLYQNKNR